MATLEIQVLKWQRDLGSLMIGGGISGESGDIYFINSRRCISRCTRIFLGTKLARAASASAILQARARLEMLEDEQSRSTMVQAGERKGPGARGGGWRHVNSPLIAI